MSALRLPLGSAHAGPEELPAVQDAPGCAGKESELAMCITIDHKVYRVENEAELVALWWWLKGKK